MAFLKRIEAYGFKSFAEPLTIEFDTNIVGIVGPNGSGKSNINDAIRWVLGEQSVKSLRGENSEDIIFNGAKGKQPLNSAQVTLVFDNTNKIFKVDFNEVQITRKTFRNSSENEYYINKARVRLKDVQEIIMGTGLAKGSLAIISQGNVSKFADSKAEERRTLFEEAAGVSKYKKRKEESLRKLERTNENLVRVNDIISEISRKIEPLAKQAQKAKTYVELRDNLKKYEITIIVKDLETYHNQLKLTTVSINDNEILQQQLNLNISKNEQQLKFLKNKSYDLDKNINSLEMNLSNANSLLQVLEQQKSLMKTKQSEIKDQTEVEKLKNEIETLLTIIEQKTFLQKKEQENFDKINNLFEELNVQHQDLILGQNNIHRGLGEKKAQLESVINYQQRQNQKYLGVQTILNNKDKLYGIIGVVSDLISVPDLYSEAIVKILGNTLKNIVTATNKDATKAVEFLKQNKAGIATFLPLNSIQVRTATKEDEIIVNSKSGYLSFAHHLVIAVDNRIQPIINFLLGRTIICEDLESARVISQLIAAKYQCVTLDGQLIKAGGAIVGGYQHQNSINVFKEKLIVSELKEEIKSLEQQLVNINVQRTSIESELNNYQGQKLTITLTINKLISEISDITNQSQLLTTQYQTLTGKKLDIDTTNQLNDIFIQYENSKYDQATIKSQLQLIRKQKHQLLEQMQTLENELYSLNQEHFMTSDKLNNQKLEQVKMESKVEQHLRRLVETYNLTYEYAREHYSEPLADEQQARNLVQQLRSEIEDLGFVNINAIEEFENENERYLRLKTKHDELQLASQSLLTAIDEMDNVMVTQFDETIKDINMVLPETFQTLFGGGTCSLRYTSPDDILNTGVEVLANPPGKRISNLNLLSGGEKSLVALAVLFAILKVKPLPLTILDEVEAPLDPANLERFARYVRSFSQYTQFIIVTHRPGTMENCDVLYGTTMQNQGITKMVAIKLADAKKIIESDKSVKNVNYVV
ncbi:AAA family ATPase [Spiroplasma ixodetis]|uniref:Chromosome partition protein Smc n=1 Tax=Spiroplasma ixodetis TaxID=2141 RepID=A0ABM8BSL8_9MOLU|nr:AAA family ATPase [Spiroplasma ixodetis]BDT02630.1 chromosome partition protein Smc [Spiroplasma ixodetis]